MHISQKINKPKQRKHIKNNKLPRSCRLVRYSVGMQSCLIQCHEGIKKQNGVKDLRLIGKYWVRRVCVRRIIQRFTICSSWKKHTHTSNCSHTHNKRICQMFSPSTTTKCRTTPTIRQLTVLQLGALLNSAFPPPGRDLVWCVFHVSGWVRFLEFY